MSHDVGVLALKALLPLRHDYPCSKFRNLSDHWYFQTLNLFIVLHYNVFG